MKRTIILADGDFPTHPIPLQALTDAQYRICCDGAVAGLVAHGYEPDVIIGDMDSIPAALHEQFRDRIHADPDQETNDLTKAVQYCTQAGCQHVTILGATGKREDHTIGNIALLARYQQSLQAIMLTDHGRFDIIHDQRTLDSIPGQQVSIFSFTPQIPITSEGLKYPLHNLLLAEWWQGTLNEATTDHFSLSAPGGILAVYRLYP